MKLPFLISGKNLIFLIKKFNKFSELPFLPPINSLFLFLDITVDNLKIVNLNILLLGSKSFIGKHIYHQLKDKLNINSLDNYFEENDILRLDNTEFCEKYFSKLSFKIDIIINLVHIHKKSFKEELNINTKLVDKICYFVEQKKIRIIHISSVNCSSDNCDNKYSYTKSSLENRIIKTNNFTILRLSTVISKNKNNEFIGGRNGRYACL